MKKILIPTDFSKHAEKSYAVAASIAKENNATVHLYHMITSWFTGSIAYTGLDTSANVSALDEASIIENQRKLDKIAQNPVFKDVDIKTEIKLTYTYDTIESLIEEINELDFGLIVLGTSGHDEKHESFAEIAARHSKCPIITCYNHVEKFDPQSILITTDFETLNSGFFKRLNAIAKNDLAKKTVLFVNTKKNFLTTKEITHGFNVVKNKYRLKNIELLVINSESVLEGINDAIDQNQFDLVSIITHGRTGLSKFLFGSKSNHLVNICPIPVLSYNLHDYLEDINEESSSFRSGFTG